MITHATLLRPAPLALVMLAGCAAPAETSPQDAFFAALASHCGKAYEGALVSTDAADADFVGAPMVMHVAECSDDRIAVPFHVQLDGAWDRSRTWVITRNYYGMIDGGEVADGISLKHDHRHQDGEPDAVTMYGGVQRDPAAGTARAQRFPVDAESIAMFEREGLGASVTNVWTVEVDPAGTPEGRFAYQLQRTVAGGAPEERLFRVEFDLTKPVDAPPPAWGHEKP